MYVILTSKPGQFATELVDGLVPVETYDYMFYGRKLAVFVIAELIDDVRIKIVDESEPPVINYVPSKFLDKFETLERARAELEVLTRFGSIDAHLLKH
jgi:hypothetical protein